MKVLFSSSVPFSLAHGGMAVQIEQTWLALEKLGVTVQPLRWWDESQPADILHYFSALSPQLIRMAQNKGIRVVQSALLGGLGAKPPLRRFAQRWARRIILKI